VFDVVHVDGLFGLFWCFGGGVEIGVVGNCNL
jgi:hypothetical protein